MGSCHFWSKTAECSARCRQVRSSWAPSCAGLNPVSCGDNKGRKGTKAKAQKGGACRAGPLSRSAPLPGWRRAPPPQPPSSSSPTGDMHLEWEQRAPRRVGM